MNVQRASRDFFEGNEMPGEATLGWDDYSPKAMGPKYPPHDMSSPLLEAKDILGLIAAAVITLGPLAASSAGFGL